MLLQLNSHAATMAATCDHRRGQAMSTFGVHIVSQMLDARWKSAQAHITTRHGGYAWNGTEEKLPVSGWAAHL